MPEPLTDKDLRKIEKEMRRIANRSPKIEKETVSRDEAREKLKEWGQHFKLEGLDLIPEGEDITFYYHGDGEERWGDLCEGPHVDSLKDLDYVFKLQHVAGAYWRGDEKNKMLQRIYGTAFWSKEELAAHLEWLEEVKKRDHRKLGTELDLFSTHEEAGSGFFVGAEEV